MSDQEILEAALATVSDEAAGNVHEDTVTELLSHSLGWVEFERTVVCETRTRIETSKRIGRRGDRAFRGPADARAAAEAYAHELMTDSGVLPMVLHILSKRDDAGFDTSRPADIRATKRTFAGEEPCPDCSGRGRLRCDPCRGDGSIACGDCDGHGKARCPQCGGAGFHDHYDPGQRRQTRQSCFGCHGTGRVACGPCAGLGKTSCFGCAGAGSNPCAPCQGEGAFTHEFVTLLTGHLSDEVEWRDVPASARRALAKTGISRLAYGHAEITPIHRSDADPRHGRARFYVRVPVGELTIGVHGETYTFDVVGTDGHARPQRPFPEHLAEPGIDQLVQAAAGRPANALRRLRAAMRFDFVRTAVFAAHWRPEDEAADALQRAYPTLEPSAARQRIEDARTANRKAGSHLARAIRRRTYGFALLPLGLVWFTLGLRRLGWSEPALGWFDLLPVLSAAAFATLWMQTRIPRAVRRLGFEAGSDKDLRWSEFRRAKNYTRVPSPSVLTVFLVMLGISALCLELGHGLGLYETQWAEWREPWAHWVDPLWAKTRTALATGLDPMRAWLDALAT